MCLTAGIPLPLNSFLGRRPALSDTQTIQWPTLNEYHYLLFARPTFGSQPIPGSELIFFFFFFAVVLNFVTLPIRARKTPLPSLAARVTMNPWSVPDVPSTYVLPYSITCQDITHLFPSVHIEQLDLATCCQTQQSAAGSVYQQQLKTFGGGGGGMRERRGQAGRRHEMRREEFSSLLTKYLPSFLFNSFQKERIFLTLPAARFEDLGLALPLLSALPNNAPPLPNDPPRPSTHSSLHGGVGSGPPSSPLPRRHKTRQNAILLLPFSNKKDQLHLLDLLSHTFSFKKISIWRLFHQLFCLFFPPPPPKNCLLAQRHCHSWLAHQPSSFF